MAQPYGDFIGDMMEAQRYPEIQFMPDGPILQPYDASGWTLPLQMGIKAEALSIPLDSFYLVPLKGVQHPESTITGDGDYYLIPARMNRSVLAVNRLLKENVPVRRVLESATLPAGDYLVSHKDVSADTLKNVLKDTGVSVQRSTLKPDDKTAALAAPRLAIYQSFRASMDEGWTRLVLDNYEFPYTILHNKDFKEADLGAKFDAILFADMNRDTIVEGASGRTGDYGGSSGYPEEYQGGIGKDGVKALKEFVNKGGSLILLDSAFDLGAKDFDLPITNVLANLGGDEFSCPGSILRIYVETDDPVSWGMEEENIILFSRSPAFRTSMPSSMNMSRHVVAGFGIEGPHLLSGYLLGGKYLDRKAMIVRFTVEKGNIIVLGGHVQNRAQTTTTFKFLFNSIYFSSMEK